MSKHIKKKIFKKSKKIRKKISNKKGGSINNIQQLIRQTVNNRLDQRLSNNNMLSLFKTLSLKSLPKFSGPTPACCPNKNIIKFVRVHGNTPNPINNKLSTYKIPEDTHVITLVQPGDILEVNSELKNQIIRLYKNNKSLFEENDTSVQITDEGLYIMDLFNKYQKENSPKLFFRNHIPGMIMNNLYLNFQSEGCTEDSLGSCRIFCLNLKSKKETECLPKQIDRNTGKHKIIQGLLSELIQNEGPGTYILNICRGTTSDLSNEKLTAMRTLSGV